MNLNFLSKSFHPNAILVKYWMNIKFILYVNWRIMLDVVSNTFWIARNAKGHVILSILNFKS